MKNLIYPAFALGFMAASPVNAQTAEDAVEEATEAAIQAAAEAVKDAAESVEIGPDGRASSPRLIDFSALDPQQADYPASSWAADEEGSVEFELTVNASGDPTSCNILESSGFEALDAKSCETALARGKFSPATDAEGQPIEGIYRDRQIWRKREPEFPGTATIHVSFIVGKDGVSRDCEVVELSGEISERMQRTFDREPCPGINRPSRALYRDENGNPVTKRIELQVIVKAETIEE